MTKKQLIRVLKDKLKGLEELNKNQTHRCYILNEYSKDLARFLNESNIDNIDVPPQLDPYKHSIAGGGPSTSETNVLNELISKYGELLALINPKKSFFSQFRETSGIFKLINFGTIISFCLFSYYLGRDTNNGAIEKLKIINNDLVDSVSHLNQKSVDGQKLIDSLQNIIIFDKKLLQEKSEIIDNLTKNSKNH